MLSYNQIDQLKVVGQITNADYLLLCCLAQYENSMQNAYIETVDLANADMDSRKIESGLRELESKGIIFFQASSIIITWADPNEEDRFDMGQIEDQLESGILSEKQSFYYEILLQKSAGASIQSIDPYNWTGTTSYEPRAITKLAYELSSESTKFTVASNDWLIEWQKSFSEFMVVNTGGGSTGLRFDSTVINPGIRIEASQVLANQGFTQTTIIDGGDNTHLWSTNGHLEIYANNDIDFYGAETASWRGGRFRVYVNNSLIGEQGPFPGPYNEVVRLFGIRGLPPNSVIKLEVFGGEGSISHWIVAE